MAPQQSRPGFLTTSIDNVGVWVSKECELSFEGRVIKLRPGTAEDAPTIVVQTDATFSQDNAETLVMRFLSAFAWVEDSGARADIFAFNTAAPMRIGRSNCRMISDRIREYLPEPETEKARLALALYREGLVANLIPYQFLAFAKVLNVLHATSKPQVDWINSTVPQLTDRRASARITELAAGGLDVGEYLYRSGRCAVAHAYCHPVVNPDELSDLRRLSRDLPLIKALARHAIRTELAIATEHDVWEEHEYELEGFRMLFGEEVAEALHNGQMVDAATLVVPPRLSLRLRGKAQLGSFAAMRCSVLAVHEGIVVLCLTSGDGGVRVLVELDFPSQRLRSSALTQHDIIDDGSKVGAQRCLDAVQFSYDYMCNGVVEVLNAETGERLGRSDVVLDEMTNMRIDHEWFNEQRARLSVRLSGNETESVTDTERHDAGGPDT